MTAADVGPNAPEHRIGGLPRDLRVVVAALPKSGSTFLTELLARLPGMRTAYPVPGYDRREQELCAESLRQEVHNTRFMRQLWRRQALAGAAPPRGFVAQLHLRHSEPTAALLRSQRVVPIVLERNLFDAVVSLADHIRDRPVELPMAYVDETMKAWPDERLQAFVADMAVPWYLNFHLCWAEAKGVKRVTYEQLAADPEATLREIADHLRLPSKPAELAAAVEAAQAATPRNVGVPGRGAQLPPAVKDRIRQLAAHYAHHDLSPLGL